MLEKRHINTCRHYLCSGAGSGVHSHTEDRRLSKGRVHKNICRFNSYPVHWRNKMPLKKCTSGGKSGYKWGDAGKCYTGPDAKKKALQQGRAIEANKSKSMIEKIDEELNKDKE